MEIALIVIAFVLLALLSSLAVAAQRKRRSGGVVGLHK